MEQYKMQGDIKATHELQRLFYNFCSLVNHLEIQDEIDKQNISLMGVMESNGDSTKELKDRNSIM